MFAKSPPPPPNNAASGMTRWRRFAWAHLCAVLAALLLALAALPAAAQTPVACEGGSCTVTITSTPANGTHYVAGEAITTRISRLGGIGVRSTSPNIFSTSTMALDIGGVTRQASVTSILRSNRNLLGFKDVDFSYTVVAADLDADGISIPQNAISGTNWLSFVNSLGVTLSRDHAALPAQSAHRVIGYTASISSTSPAVLTEGNLNNATVAVALVGATFGSGVTASSFELVTTMTGVTIASVSSVSSGATAATLTLSSTADIAADATLAVRVLAAAHSQNTNVTTGTVRVAPVGALTAGSGASTDAISVAVEEGSTGFYTVVLSSDPGATCTAGVTIGITSDSPAVTVSPATINFTSANWSIRRGITATGVEDGNLDDETATISHAVTAACPDYPTGLAIASVTVSVDDNDTSLLTIDSPRVVEGDSGSTRMAFTVTLSAPVSAQVSVAYAAATMAGTATSGTDYAFASPVLYLGLAPGQTSETLRVNVTGDTDMEGDETVRVALGALVVPPTPASVVVSTAMGVGTGTIVDDDTPTLTIDSPSVAEGNAGTTDLTFTVTLSPAAASRVDVNYIRNVGGTAEEGTDFTDVPSASLEFTAGETSKTITVPVRGDSVVEPDETVHMLIYNALISTGTVRIRGADGIIAVNATGVGTITNDDFPAPPEPTDEDEDGTSDPEDAQLPDVPETACSTVPAEAPEGGTATAIVELAAAVDGLTTVRWHLARDTDAATADADAGDHGGVSGEVQIGAGERCAEIEIDILDDEDAEPAREWFTVVLRASVGAQLARATIPVAVMEGVCDRTPLVSSALLTATDAASCEVPAPADLHRVSELTLAEAGLDALAADDFGDLTGLRMLDLAGNGLTALPALPSLVRLERLLLPGNALEAVPLAALPAPERLRELILSNNAFSELPTDAFSAAPGLRSLRLDGNRLNTLPAGLFAGSSSLRLLRLDGNPGTPFMVRVNLERADAEPWASAPAMLRAVVPLGAPFEFAVGLTAEGATFADGGTASEATVAGGQTAGQTVAVYSAGGFARVALTVPPLPDRQCLTGPCWQGFTLEAGAPLALFARRVLGDEPVPLFGEDLRVSLSLLAEAGELSGDLEWSVYSSDPSLAGVHIAGGHLLVEPAFGAEGDLRVEATATDANGQTTTVYFDVRVEFHWPTRSWREIPIMDGQR